jgi:UDP-N-acetylglucosamine:LPS N-acetylglucosamine transferase
MKVIITGGGTGGHIIPALAILDILKESYIDLSILYILNIYNSMSCCSRNFKI